MARAAAARCNDAGYLVVTFDDRFRVTFIPNTGGFDNPPRRNEEIRLDNHVGLRVATFYSPNQYPLNKRGPKGSEFGFQRVEHNPRVRALTVAEISEYFSGAINFVRGGAKQEADAGKPGKYTDYWRVAYPSLDEIESISVGQFPLPMAE